jgi:hypothetical protein
MMRTLIGFFAGLTIFALIVAMLAVAIRVYDYGAASKLNSVMLQPTELHTNRMSAPTPLDNYPVRRMRNHLLATVAAEYLRVLPTEGELDARENGLLRLVCAPGVVAKWRKETLPGLLEMSGAKKMRHVVVDMRGISDRGDYAVVPFVLRTWNNPNDLDAMPVTDKGQEMYMKVRFNRKVREMRNGREFDAGDYLDRGFPPAAIFEFIVDEIIIK